jgi:hypothetical protein
MGLEASLVGSGQLNGKPAALTHLAFDLEIAAVGLSNSLRDRQPQPRATRMP